jgi:hypothetical protein
VINFPLIFKGSSLTVTMRFSTSKTILLGVLVLIAMTSMMNESQVDASPMPKSHKKDNDSDKDKDIPAPAPDSKDEFALVSGFSLGPDHESIGQIPQKTGSPADP